MTTEHDFKKALNAYESNTYDTPQEWVSCAGVIGDSELYETIRFALRLADKLLGQEPSFEMKQAGSQKVGSDYEVRGTFGIAVDTFKSMLTTAVKEIENDRTRSQF